MKGMNSNLSIVLIEYNNWTHRRLRSLSRFDEIRRWGRETKVVRMTWKWESSMNSSWRFKPGSEKSSISSFQRIPVEFDARIDPILDEEYHLFVFMNVLTHSKLMVDVTETALPNLSITEIWVVPWSTLWELIRWKNRLEWSYSRSFECSSIVRIGMSDVRY